MGLFGKFTELATSYEGGQWDGPIAKAIRGAGKLADKGAAAAGKGIVKGVKKGAEAAKNKKAEKAALAAAEAEDEDEYIEEEDNEEDSEVLAESGSSSDAADSFAAAKEKITQLKEMLDSGLITQDDFDSKKKEILSEI